MPYAPLEYENRYDPKQLPPPLFRETDLAVQERLRTHVFQRYSGEPGEREQQFKATFYGMMELIDENIGRMLDALEETGQRENTLVIATSITAMPWAITAYRQKDAGSTRDSSTCLSSSHGRVTCVKGSRPIA